MADSIDAELITLINKLNKIQQQVGGGKNAKTLVGEDGKIDHFIDLRNQMMERLAGLKETIAAIKDLEKSPGSNPKELISAQSKVRTDLTSLNDDWKELDALYRGESKKKRSKYSPEELENRLQMLIHLQLEIQTIKEIQRSGYVKGYTTATLGTMEENEMFRSPEQPSANPQASKLKSTTPQRGVVGQRNDNMTEDHRVQLHRLRQRDLQIDDEIVNIGHGVDDLRELALGLNEEVKVQNKMLTTLETKIETVQDDVININERLKTTLEEARRSDKICMDIFCVMIMVGMIIVLVKLTSKK